MTDSAAGFELLGDTEDETRLLLHRGCGYSIPIPGHPVVSREPPPESPRFDVVIQLSDLPVAVLFRLDVVPTGMQAEALATSLVQAYATGRAADTPRGGPVGGSLVTPGADGQASLIYSLPESGGKQQMEHVSVTAHAHPEGLWALYQSMRHSNQEVNPVKWAHLRNAMYRNAHWDPAQPRTSPPALWPPSSAFAELSGSLTLTEEAWAEAQAKATDIGPLTDDQVVNSIRLFITFSNSDHPPTFELHSYLLDMTSHHVAAQNPSRAADAFLRNINQVKTMHDFRAWIWQCIWAIGNRTDRGPDQR